MSQLRGSASYIWDLTEQLGQGATGNVYKARHKRTGDLFAVKVFNSMSHMRPLGVQMREFEVLRKLNHINIVKLLAVEDEVGSHAKVLIMELCTGGSLYSLIDDPENGYGLSEKEFLIVLRDLASGLKHLHDNNIVHRDIKPGNIMRYIGTEGRTIYKLIDFGAARELPEDEPFMSLYGTEEYLYPDVYERAVLKRSNGKLFTSVVDRWSVGVTLYHAATGEVPFRPYGGRKNKDMMFQIMTKKEKGVISGVQTEDNGPIIWSRDLPSTCRFSEGLRRLVVPLIAGLMEREEVAMMTFEAFYVEAMNIVQKDVVMIYDLCSSSLLQIYVNKTECIERLQELIAEQTDVARVDQFILFENHPLEQLLPRDQTVGKLPLTTQQNPMYLLSGANCLSTANLHLNIPTLPLVTAELQLTADVLLAKNNCSFAYHFCRQIADCILNQQHISRAANMYLLVISQEIAHLKDTVCEWVTMAGELMKRASLVYSCLEMIDRSKVRSSDQTSIMNGTKRQSMLQLNNYQQLVQKVVQLRHDVDSCDVKINDRSPSSLKQLRDDCCKEDDYCSPRAEVIVSLLRQTYTEFSKQRERAKKLSYNEEQIHKFEKQRMAVHCNKISSLAKDHFFSKLKYTHQLFVNWYRDVYQVQSQLQQLRQHIQSVCEEQIALTETLDQLQNNSIVSMGQLRAIPQLDVMSLQRATNDISASNLPRDKQQLKFVARDMISRVPANLAHTRSLIQQSENLEKQVIQLNLNAARS